MNNEERQAAADAMAEGLKRANEEFIRDTPGVHKPGYVAEDGKYGDPFHDKVAAYIKGNQAKLQTAFMQGFHSREQERAMAYLVEQGIINSTTPTARINEFLAAWNIPPLPVEDEPAEAEGPIDVGEVTMMASPSQDDEIVDAEVVED